MAFVYVALGTIFIYSIYPDDPFSGDYSFIGLFLTFPVSLIGFAYRLSEHDPQLTSVLIIQAVLLLFLFLILRKIFCDSFERRRLKNRHPYLNK